MFNSYHGVLFFFFVWHNATYPNDPKPMVDWGSAAKTQIPGLSDPSFGHRLLMGGEISIFLRMLTDCKMFFWNNFQLSTMSEKGSIKRDWEPSPEPFQPRNGMIFERWCSGPRERGSSWRASIRTRNTRSNGVQKHLWKHLQKHHEASIWKHLRHKDTIFPCDYEAARKCWQGVS